MKKVFKTFEMLLLPLPFPVVFIWWIIIGGFLGAAIFGATYKASIAILPITVVGIWRVIVKHKQAVAEQKRIQKLLKK